jgi:hypothetical protein
MLLLTLLNVSLALALAITNSFPVGLDECPTAVLVCHKSESGASRYDCSAVAQYPSKREAPQYTWAVSEGEIIGDPKAPNITVDVAGVKSEAVSVTLKIHWKRVPKVCDVSKVEEIKLR